MRNGFRKKANDAVLWRKIAMSNCLRGVSPRCNHTVPYLPIKIVKCFHQYRFF